MSKKLQAAIQQGEVTVRNRRSVEVSVWFRDREGRRRVITLGPNASENIVPKLTDAPFLRWSNLKDRTKKGDIEIL